MKKRLIILTALAILSTANAENFFGSATSTNTVTISTNEAIVISAVAGGYRADGSQPGVAVLFYAGTTTNRVNFGHAGILKEFRPVILAGPLQFTIRPTQDATNETAMISFRRFKLSAAKTQFIPQGTTNIVLTVASNQSVHFVRSMTISVAAEIETPNGSALLPIYGDDEEFEGPAAIRFFGSEYVPVSCVTYYITEGAIALPNLGVVRAPSGTFELTVEKSANLTNWIPVIGHVTSESGPSFYRFRFSR